MLLGSTDRDTFFFGTIVTFLHSFQLPSRFIYIVPLSSLFLLLFYVAPTLKKVYRHIPESYLILLILTLWFGVLNVSAFVQFRAGLSIALCVCSFAALIANRLFPCLLFVISGLSVHLLACLFCLTQFIVIILLYQQQKIKYKKSRLSAINSIKLLSFIVFLALFTAITLYNDYILSIFDFISLPNLDYYFKAYFSSDRTHILTRLPVRFYLILLVIMSIGVFPGIRKYVLRLIQSIYFPYIFLFAGLYAAYLYTGSTVLLKIASPYISSTFLLIGITLSSYVTRRIPDILNPIVVFSTQSLLSLLFILKAS